jgi:hypothetical protein
MPLQPLHLIGRMAKRWSLPFSVSTSYIHLAMASSFTALPHLSQQQSLLLTFITFFACS